VDDKTHNLERAEKSTRTHYKELDNHVLRPPGTQVILINSTQVEAEWAIESEIEQPQTPISIDAANKEQ
jgi:hypothetical protein